MPVVYNEIDGTQKTSEWIRKGLNQDAILFANGFGYSLKEKQFSTSQIRAAFGEVRRIQMKGLTNTFESEVLLLKPKLAYAKARGKEGSSKEGAGEFLQICAKAIDAVFEGNPDNDEKFRRFENFASLFEAILAYHRSFGGK